MKKGFAIGLCMLLTGRFCVPAEHIAGFNSWWIKNYEPSRSDGVSMVGEPDWDKTETDGTEDGETVRDTETAEIRLEESLTALAESGSGASSAVEEGQWVSLGDDWTITYYCPLECCNDQWAWQTSTQEPMQLHHTIAVDPDVIPYYTHVRIGGLDYEYVAEDCGGGIDGKQIDVLVENCQLARELGVDRGVEVWVRR